MIGRPIHELGRAESILQTYESPEGMTSAMRFVPLVGIVLALASLTPVALAHHASPFSTWMQFHADSDWTTIRHAQSAFGFPPRFMTNVVCLGDAQTSMASPGDVTGLTVDLVGPLGVAGPATASFTINVGAPRPECPTASGPGTITFTMTGRYEDHAPGNALTIFGGYAVTGTGAYATVSGGGTFSASFTGMVDATSGYPTLLDGAFVGGTRY